MGLFDIFKKKEPAPQAESTRHCFVLCGASEPSNLANATEVVARIFGNQCTAEVGEGNMVSVNRGEENIGFLAHMPAPIPGGEAEGNADGNFLWPNGKEEAAKHQSHVIVTNIGGEEQTPIVSAMTVSRLTLAALEIFDGIGVYWGNASVSNSRAIFEEFCGNISEEHLPLPVWLRFQPVRQSDNEIGLYTIGMSQFGLMDIEVDRCTMGLEELFEFVSNIAHYLVQSGPVIADGNTVGGSEEERIVVHHRPSMVDANRKVYKIVFDA